LAAAPPIVIRNVAVVDVAAGKVIPQQTVVIRGERIAWRGPTRGVAVPRGALVVNGAGKYLLPGLWDMQVRLGPEGKNLARFLDLGITGISETGGDARVARWRSEIENGRRVGPRIVTSGFPVAGAASEQEALLVARTPRDARAVFDQLWNSRVDFVSIRQDLPRDAYFALAEQARHWRRRFEGPVPSGVSLWEALEARQASIQQSSELSRLGDRELPEFLRRSALMGTRLTPLLASASDKIQAFRLAMMARAAGVEILAGSGAQPDTLNLGAGLHEELEQLVAAGFTPREALEAATLAPLRLLGWDGVLGRIEAGRVADMILVEANPLADIRHARQIAAVFVGGRNRWVPSSAAKRRPASSREPR
jgi:imidazolonepropionase-like amidohydrolase